MTQSIKSAFVLAIIVSLLTGVLFGRFIDAHGSGGESTGPTARERECASYAVYIAAQNSEKELKGGAILGAPAVPWNHNGHAVERYFACLVH